MNIENASSIGATLRGGLLVGILIGYSLKKLVKLFAIVVIAPHRLEHCIF